MIVSYDHQLYELDMPFMLFESYKKLKPEFLVNATELTQSSYKKILTVQIQYLEDYSIERNTLALRN